MHDVSPWSSSNLVYFRLDDFANATMRHSVTFKCANDAKKNYPNIYFHMDSCENLNPCVNPLLSYFWTIFTGFHVEIYIRIILLCIISTFEVVWGNT